MPAFRLVQRGRAAALLAALALGASLLIVPAATATATATGPVRPDHIFVIMMENHGFGEVICTNPAASDCATPYITHLAQRFGLATQYYGVTHDSRPNYIAAISGNNWYLYDDANPSSPGIDHTNLVDQLQGHGFSWAAYMESLPAGWNQDNNWPSDTAKLYAPKHNPFAYFTDIRSSAARMAMIKPLSKLSTDLNGPHAPDFVWISPNQCHDMHGGVTTTVAAADGTPCPYDSTSTPGPADFATRQKGDAFVAQTVHMITTSKAWTGNSVIFIAWDEDDFAVTNQGCCNSPLLPPGANTEGFGDNWPPAGANATSAVAGGGRVAMIVVARHGVRGYTNATPFNHYSLLKTVEDVWGLGELGMATDNRQVKSLTMFLAH
jgi:phosphatidylinositol-3-phosphatase